MDPRQAAAFYLKAIPMAATLGLQYRTLTHNDCVMVLADQPEYRNHVGGPHAGAMFTLGESAAGSLVVANLGEYLEELTPLAGTVTVTYTALALGEITATAHADLDVDAIRTRVAQGEKPSFEIAVQLHAAGQQTGELVVTWVVVPRSR